MIPPGQSYISGFSIPQFFDDDVKKDYLRKWIMAHSQDHTNIFGILNNLEKELNEPLFEINEFSLFFDPATLDSFNNFLSKNSFQHQEFGGWINQIGATLPNYDKPPLVYYTILNPLEKVLDLSLETYNRFLFQEYRVHVMVLSAINNLFRAFGITEET